MKLHLIDTWGIDANTDDTNDYTTSNPEDDYMPFSLWDITPAEMMAGVFGALIVWALAWLILPLCNYGGQP